MITKLYLDGVERGSVSGIYLPPDGDHPYTLEYVLVADDVRLEAQRRMMLLIGARDAADLDIKIANGSREAIRLLRKGSENWTAEESARASVLEQVDVAIEAIRAASNAMEDAPPDDYADDKHWP